MKEEADSLGKQTGVVDYDVKEQSEHYENIYLDVSERLKRAEQIKWIHLDEIIYQYPILGFEYIVNKIIKSLRKNR